MTAEERRRQRAGKVIIGVPQRLERVPESRWSRWRGNTVLRLNPTVRRRQIMTVLFLLAALGVGTSLFFLLFELLGVRFCDWDGCLAAIMRSLLLQD